MSEQAPLPGVPVPSEPPKRTQLTDLELMDIRKKLIEGNGKIEVLGPNALDIMRDVYYTCRMKANPMQEEPDAEGKPKKEKKVKGESTDKKKITGLDVNSLMG